MRRLRYTAALATVVLAGAALTAGSASAGAPGNPQAQGLRLSCAIVRWWGTTRHRWRGLGGEAKSHAGGGDAFLLAGEQG